MKNLTPPATVHQTTTTTNCLLSTNKAAEAYEKFSVLFISSSVMFNQN